MDNETMTNEIPTIQDREFVGLPKRKYDLRERTELFGKHILRLAKNIQINIVTKPLVQQLVRSGTSIGANYCEADDALTKKDFIYRIGVSRKEAKETKYWLRMLVEADASLAEITGPLLNESQELVLIFSSIINKARK